MGKSEFQKKLGELTKEKLEEEKRKAVLKEVPGIVIAIVLKTIGWVMLYKINRKLFLAFLLNRMGDNKISNIAGRLRKLK